MTCCAARSTLPLLLDGQLAAGERSAAIDKAMACQLCRAELTAMQALQIFYLSVLIVPQLLIVFGIVVWWRRKSR